MKNSLFNVCPCISFNTGTITKVIDPVNNLSYTSSYDSTDRLIGTTVIDTATGARKAAFEYDFYNSNHISNITTKTENGTHSVGYDYIEDNLLDKTTLPNGKMQSYTYDNLGRLQKVETDTTVPITTAYGYFTANFGSETYNTTLLRREENEYFAYRYDYDNNGNINKIYPGTKNVDGTYSYGSAIEEYTYDALGQLTEVKYNTTHKRHVYTYDLAGNIQSEAVFDTADPETLLTTNTYTYGDSSWGDLLTGYNNDTFTYDTIGNPLSYRDGITFTWSNGRQLQSYSKGSTNVSYTYDNSGLRLSKNVNGTQYTYLYHGGNLMQETVGTNILDYFYDASGKPLAVKYRTSANATGTYYYYARNSRGDVIGLYDITGALYRTYTYDVWGNILSVKDANGTDITSQTDIAHLQSLRYRGYYYDSDTGLYYLQSRYYIS